MDVSDIFSIEDIHRFDKGKRTYCKPKSGKSRVNFPNRLRAQIDDSCRLNDVFKVKYPIFDRDKLYFDLGIAFMLWLCQIYCPLFTQYLLSLFLLCCQLWNRFRNVTCFRWYSCWEFFSHYQKFALDWIQLRELLIMQIRELRIWLRKFAK